jgi:hypothetical protein
VFSGATLFSLEALGVLPNVAAISSVSGGSFAGSYYAASCDDGDMACQARPLRGLTPPVWKHSTTMPILGGGYGPLIPEQIARAVLPFVPATISAPRFAEFIDERYFDEKNPRRDRLRFMDLNPRRPHLFLNATITSRNRGGLDERAVGNCKLSRRGYLRRRTPDEWFHFAFSDYYFGLLNSDLATYPVSAGVAASAAFVALIDPAELQDGCSEDGSVIKLIDGGANDNQALIEIYMILAELGFGQQRSDLVITPPASPRLASNQIQAMGQDDRAWVLVVNSSVTSTTGPAGSPSGPQPRGLIELISSVARKAFEVIDVFTAEGFALRSQLYLNEKDRLKALRVGPTLIPMEISLTELDQYGRGGTEAALRQKANYAPTETDPGDQRSALRAARQAASYHRLVRDGAARARLGLSNWHPQCYFDIRDRLDASLINLPAGDQACLREAARWATALRMQEACNFARETGVAPPQGLSCGANGEPVLVKAAAIAPIPGPECSIPFRVESLAEATAKDDDPADICQPLP